MLVNCNVIVFFTIYAQFPVIRKPYSARIAYTLYIFINNNFFSYKNWKQN